MVRFCEIYKKILQLSLYLLPVLYVCLATGTQAASLAGWSISGSNTIRGEYYDVDGDQGASPWPHTGSQFFDELDLNLHRRVSPWETVRFHLSGLANSSDYRSNERGGVLERGLLFWEKGDSAIPFRLQAGDYYAAQSPRTLQRGLKGLQIELQPWAGQSIQLFSGIAAPVYRNLDSALGVYSGASWLIEGQALGAFSLIGVHHNRGADNTQVELSQTVVSLAWYKPFSIGAQDLEVETELALFTGEHDAGGSLVDTEDEGYYVQLASRAKQLSYRVLYERYGEDFRPAGGALTANHRGLEGHAGWVFVSGLQLRGRVQSFRDDLESANPLDTKVVGLSLSGPLWSGSDLYVGVDTFIQRREDRMNTLDADTRNISLNLNKPLTPQLSVRGGLLWTGTDDRLTDVLSISRQLNVAMDAGFSAGYWRSTISPGFALRNNSGGNDSSEISPTLALSLSRGGHNMLFSHNWIRQDGHSSTANDTDLQQTSFAYSYQKGQHRLGLEVYRFDRDPDSGADTEAYRLSAYWTVSFDRPAPAVAVMPVAGVSGGHSVVMPTLLELRPGMSLAEIERRLAQNHQKPAYRLPGMEVYETRLLNEIDLRQRLALIHESGNLRAAVLALDFVDTGNATGMARVYARVRDLMLKKYGAPENYLEEGLFSDKLAIELTLGRFERMLEWSTESGRLRFGIPQRLDGNVRMEILHTTEIPPGRNWGVEALR